MKPQHSLRQLIPSVGAFMCTNYIFESNPSESPQIQLTSSYISNPHVILLNLNLTLNIWCSPEVVKIQQMFNIPDFEYLGASYEAFVVSMPTLVGARNCGAHLRDMRSAHRLPC
ncbi:hypothetical protein KIN20_037200 [Parelaphostrongylus tenuis]|uniref:Uncharacterized protein n=1 Tax=Parelaphostrongylus tenuis TaxID=148309 RepID=A0AAD5RDY0_PARTN|nr:hypothetical protein KIN20_037200 [Parelaphostrongylus tenuis]